MSGDVRARLHRSKSLRAERACIRSSGWCGKITSTSCCLSVVQIERRTRRTRPGSAFGSCADRSAHVISAQRVNRYQQNMHWQGIGHGDCPLKKMNRINLKLYPAPKLELLDVTGHKLNTFHPRRRPAVHRRRMAAVNKLSRDVAADRTAAPCDKYLHRLMTHRYCDSRVTCHGTTAHITCCNLQSSMSSPSANAAAAATSFGRLRSVRESS